MKKKTSWSLLLLLLITTTKNAEARGEISQRDPLRDIEMTQRLLELRRQQEYIDEQLQYPTRNERRSEKSEIVDIEEGKKYLFPNIVVEGSTLYKSEINKTLKKYLNTEMGKKEIYELLTDLSNIFLSKGYMTTIVTLKSGNVNTGTLVYEIKEGKVNEIKYKDENTSLMKKLKLKLAFPLKKNEMLTTQGMDQGIENMNIGGNNNVAEVSAAEEYGYSDLIIEENYNPTGFSVGLDNSGYKDKGRYKVNFNFSQSNLLGLNDRLTLNYIERLTKQRKDDREPNYDLGYAIPFGYWSLAYNYNLGDNYNTIRSDIGSYKTESKSQKHKIKLSRILSRGEQHKTTAYGTLVLKDNFNTMNGLVLDVSTKKYTNFVIGIDHTNRLLGGTIFGILEYERGVPWFGGEKDPEVFRSGDYKVEYDKFNFNLDWMRPFAILNQNFQYRMGMGGSYSEDRLLSANQFSMGDEFTVRGFKESSVSGNKGVYINNTISYMGTKDMNRFLAIFQPFIGLDGGISRDKDLPTSDKLVGGVVGVRANFNGLSAALTYGVPLRWAQGMPREKNPLYLNVNYRM
ncbi:MAG: ShlB/FhaC/HecB family hemolysin secretion/activation protein [Cetobacterium sp.]